MAAVLSALLSPELSAVLSALLLSKLSAVLSALLSSNLSAVLSALLSSNLSAVLSALLSSKPSAALGVHSLTRCCTSCYALRNGIAGHATAGSQTGILSTRVVADLVHPRVIHTPQAA